MSSLREVLHPERYHGHGKRPPFFEGWYFKLVDAAGQHKYAVIPGVFISDDPAKHHAFVQVLNGTTGSASYHVYAAEQFGADRDSFRVQIGPNEFGADRIRLAISGQGGSVEGEVTFHHRVPWPVRLRSPGIMGWYAWAPGMECYHGVVSLDHALAGTLVVDEEAADLTGGRGYIEKDWGKSFPAAWIWMQTNHFETPGVCLTASIAIIPWLRSAFPGFIIGFWHDGRLFRFATYTGAKTEHLEIGDEHVTWIVSDRLYRLEMSAARTEGGLIYGPTREEMHKRVNETMNARVTVTLRERGGRVLFRDTGRHAGMEVQGDLAKLLALQK